MNIILSKYIVYLSKEIQYNLTKGELNKIKNFVTHQINLAPRYMSLLIFFLSHLLFLFYKFFVVVFFKNKKNECFINLILFIKKNNIKSLIDLINLYENLIIIKILEKKI